MGAGGRGQTWGGVGSSYQVPKWVANNNKVSCLGCTVLLFQGHALPAAAGWSHVGAAHKAGHTIQPLLPLRHGDTACRSKESCVGLSTCTRCTS